MITVESSANPVYSNAVGVQSKKAKRQEARQTRRANRKAKRLKKVRLRSGKTANVYVLTKLMPKKSGFEGEYFGVDAVTTLTQSQDFIKTNPDGTTSVIPKEDVVQSSTGAYYDKNEVAKVYQVDKSTVTQPMIDRITVAVAPTGDNPTSTEQQKTTQSDLGIVVDEKNVQLDANGEPFLKIDVQAGAENMTEEQKAEASKKEAEEEKKKRTRKMLIWGGVGLLVIVAGVLVYRKMSKGN